VSGTTGARRAGLDAALAGLTSRDRLILALLLIEGLSTAEAATVMGEPSRRVARDYRSLIAALRRRSTPAAPAATRRRNVASRTRRAA